MFLDTNHQQKFTLEHGKNSLQENEDPNARKNLPTSNSQNSNTLPGSSKNYPNNNQNVLLPNKSNQNSNLLSSTTQNNITNDLDFEAAKFYNHLKLFEAPVAKRKFDSNDINACKRTLSSKGIAKTVFKASTSSEIEANIEQGI